MLLSSDRLLLRFCRRSDAPDYVPVGVADVEGALSLLRREVPNFANLVRGRRVVDFGCGIGHEAVALAKEEGCRVWGVDPNPVWLEKARARAAAAHLTDDQIQFIPEVPKELKGSVDVVISQNALEHYADPAAVVRTMRELLGPNGLMIVTFGPPWFSPFGAHMNFFCRCPWVHLLFTEDTVLRVRSQYRNDGAARYEDVEGGLNRMSVREAEGLMRNGEARCIYRGATGIRGQHWLTKVPGLRELFTMSLTYVVQV